MRKYFQLIPLIVGILAISAFLVFKDKPNSEFQSYALTVNEPIIIDHTSVELFDRIPDSYIQEASQLKMLFMDRSVGSNINDGLNCLRYPSSDRNTPNHCKRYNHPDPRFSVDPSEVTWTRGYDRSNFDFDFFYDTWEKMTENFIRAMDSGQYPGEYDVYSFQFSYLNVTDNDTIADASNGFFANRPGDYNDVYDLERRIAEHPDKVFVFWTTSLSRGIGNAVSRDFNNQMRQYAIANNKVLLDVADIQSHDPAGNPCYDNRDGVYYSNGNISENYPDDGVDYPAICQHYTSEIDGGHLGSPSAGKIRIAKAIWVMMARLAGWNPDGLPAPSPTNIVSPTNTTIVSITPTNTPLPTFTPIPTPTPTTAVFTPTPTPPQSGSNQIYVADIDNLSDNINSSYFRARARVYVASDGQAVSGANVYGTITYNNQTYTANCSVPTNNSGFCNVSVIVPTSAANAVFRVTSVTANGFVYNSSLNSDPEGDSNGTEITLAP